MKMRQGDVRSIEPKNLVGFCDQTMIQNFMNFNKADFSKMILYKMVITNKSICCKYVLY